MAKLLDPQALTPPFIYPGFFLGDGRLRYGQEKIIEFFYNVNLAKNSTVTLDWQNMKNPGYNLDRGPVNVIGFRLHQTF